MSWAWDTPTAASFRISTNIDANGEYALGEATARGTKSVTFGYVNATTALATLCTGDTAVSVTGTRYGLVSTFLGYVLDATYSESTARKTLTYKAVEV